MGGREGGRGEGEFERNIIKIFSRGMGWVSYGMGETNGNIL